MTKDININLSKKLTSSLSENYANIVDIISSYSKEFGAKVYIIGGAIRDKKKKKPIYDIDFVVEGNAIEFCHLLEARGIAKIVQTTEDFGTAKIEFNNIKLRIDLASTRTEEYPKPAHLPVVKKIGCSLKEDILRRDFSVNSLAMSLSPNNFGELIDYTNGLEDIENKKLRVLHEKSFIDDPTRIIRGLRFIHKLGFELEPKTKLLQQKYLNDFNNQDICYERIKQVTNLAFSLNSSELYDDFIREKIYKLLTTTPRQTDGKAIHTAIQKYSNLVSKENIWLIYLANLITSTDAEKLNLSSKETEIISYLDELLANLPYLKNNFEIYKFFKPIPYETIVAYLGNTKDASAEKYLEKLKDTKPLLNGNDLKKLGFTQGTIIGEALNIILEQKINGKISSMNDEILLAKDILRKKNTNN